MWPGTGYRSVKLPGFGLLQSMTVPGLCAAGMNGLRCLTGEVRNGSAGGSVGRLGLVGA